VLMTGAIDYLSDGERVIAVENGHHYLSQVTGVSIPGAGPSYM
jgi:thiamine-phosphate diphosphorylase/hydroxyethylthiazole kinase